MNEWIVSVSGIRGVVGECFAPHRIARMAAAFGTHLGTQTTDPPEVVIARDTRTSGPMTRHAVVAGLLATGCQVVDFGICPTPTLLLASKLRDAAGSIMITASHNPVEWNGLEIGARAGFFLTSDARADILRRYDTEDLSYQSWERQGSLQEDASGIDTHLDRILASSYVDPEAIRRQKLRVVVDAANGAGSVITPRLLEQLGCEVIRLYCEPTGIFQREPEPTPKHLNALCNSVRKHRADVGLAHDADADRLTLVTEKGEAISEEYTLALTADFVLSKQPGTVMTTVSTSLMVNDVAARYGATVERTRVGVNHVVDGMRIHQAVIGGEGTGGIIFPELHDTSDGIMAAAVIAQLLAETERPLSSLVSEIPQYYLSKQSLPVLPGVDPDAILERALEFFADEQLDTTDGVKILRGHSWVSIRKSGTEPVIRVFGEARSPEQADAFCGEIAGHIESWMERACT